MKKFLSVILTIVMTLGLAIPAFAAETTYSITINNKTEGHTYEAYQIFSGDLHGKVLSNILWAEGQTTHTVGEDAKEVADGLKTEADAEALIKTLTLGTVAGSTNTLTDQGTYVISGLKPGYYVIKDANDTLDGKDDAYTKFIIKIVGNVTASPKSAKPTVDKKVLDEIEDADTMAKDGWGETADHAINESYKYKLIADIPNNDDFNAYTEYKLVFHDEMPAGVTFESIESVKVTAAGGAVTEILKKDDANPNGYECDATPGQAGDIWNLTIADLLKVVADIKGAKVEVIYNAHLNNNAKIGAAEGNVNKAYLKYSNNPNNTSDLGKTAEDWTWVFTLTMENKKIDGDTKAALAGAGFRLYDATGAEVKLVFDNAKDAYRPIEKDENNNEGVEMISAENTGIFNIIGLDAGEYTLKETTVPGGYNKCKDIKIKISAVHSDLTTDPYKASCTVTKYMNGDATNDFTIENNKGAVLPETGGMGTVIFYVIGGVLVAGAVIVLITRRRMAAEK